MSKKYVVVNGATCKCQFSVELKTDILEVKSQNKHYANDKNADKKLIANTKDIGKTLKANTFGKCKKQPSGNDYLPCQVVITEWQNFYEKVTLSNQGKILIETSTASCAIGGTDSISIINHGQKAELSKQNIMRDKPIVSNIINPLVNMKKFQNDLIDDDIL